MPILDTDILSVIQRRSEPAYGRIVKRLRELGTTSMVAVTVVSFEEQLRGWLEYIKRATPAQLPAAYAKLSELNQDFSTRPVLPFTDAAARVYQQLLAQNLRIGTMDLRIAAIAIESDDLLVTSNLRDFKKVPRLRCQDWAKPT